MSNRILVLGDGAAGTIISNKLRFLIPTEDADITVIGNSKFHYFKPDGIHIPLGMKRYQDSVKKPEFLFNIHRHVFNGKDTIRRKDIVDLSVFKDTSFVEISIKLECKFIWRGRALIWYT